MNLRKIEDIKEYHANPDGEYWLDDSKHPSPGWTKLNEDGFNIPKLKRWIDDGELFIREPEQSDPAQDLADAAKNIMLKVVAGDGVCGVKPPSLLDDLCEALDAYNESKITSFSESTDAVINTDNPKLRALMQSESPWSSLPVVETVKMRHDEYWEVKIVHNRPAEIREAESEGWRRCTTKDVSDE